MNDKEKLIEDDIVEMLDSFMAAGGGHMNVDVSTISKEITKQVEEAQSYECNSKSMACQVPTLHEGLDLEE